MSSSKDLKEVLRDIFDSLRYLVARFDDLEEKVSKVSREVSSIADSVIYESDGYSTSGTPRLEAAKEAPQKERSPEKVIEALPPKESMLPSANRRPRRARSVFYNSDTDE